MEIKVLGPGCAKCARTFALVGEVLAGSGVEASLSKVTDFQEMVRMGVFSTPALAVDGEVKCSGRTPSKEEIAAWIGA